MSKSDLTMTPTGTPRGLSRRGRLLSLVIGLLAFAGVGMAGPVASQAAEYFEVNNSGTWTSVGNGSTINLGVIAPGSSVDKQFRLRSNSTVFSNTQRNGRFTFSDANFEYISNCSGTSYTFTQHDAFSFTIGKRQGSFSSSYDCAWTARVKNTLAPGTYSTTLTWQNSSNWNVNGSASLTYVVTEEAGASVRLYGPDNSQSEVTYDPVANGDVSPSQVIRLRNTGSTNMTGASYSTTGDFQITANTCTANLNAAAECQISVRFAPSAVGTRNGTLDVTSGSGHARSIALTGESFPPTAELSVTPTSHDYGDVVHGFPAAETFTVSNDGNTTLNLSLTVDPGLEPGVFFRDGGTCGPTLGVGLTCTIIGKFNPAEAVPAMQSGSFTVTGTTPLVPTPASDTVAVSGTRVPPVSSIETRNTAGTAEVSSHNFDSVALGSTGSYTFSIANTGNITIPSIGVALSGPEAGVYSISGNTCGSPIIRDTSCQVTVNVNPQLAFEQRATLTLTPAPAVATAAPRSIDLTTNATGIRIKNDDPVNLGSAAKRWLDTPSLGVAGTVPGDVVRVAFEVELPSGSNVAGVDIVGATTTNDSAPGSGYQDIASLLSGKVTVERKPGSNQALVRAEVPLNSTALGTSMGNYGLSSGTDLILGCTGGTGKNDNRRVWFRVRGTNGEVSPTMGSIVRFHNQLYACPYNQGPYLSNQKILEVGGEAVPNNTIEANADKNEPVTFQFNTRIYTAGAVYPSSDGNVDAMDWRIRNSKTGAMFRWNGSGYEACGAPCVVTSSTNRYAFPEGGAQGVRNFTLPAGIPARGRWIVEASPQGSNENDSSYFQLGVVRVNDRSGNSPTITRGGTLGLRPNTDQAYTVTANVADPLDPVNAYDSQGGRAQVIEWDLDGDTSNGPNGDGFEIRTEADPGSNINPVDLTKVFDTTGKTPGPYTIRMKVTDNGAMMSNDGAAQSKILEYTTIINSPAEATEETVEFESDHEQPASVTFNATDVDGDEYRVDITPNGSNTGTLGGNHSDGIGQNTKPYTWPASFTGSDTFDFVATDDHNGQGGHQTLTVRVRPNTQIDSSTVAGLLHPDESNPATRFLGSTTSTDAEFTFSSLQNPVVEMECRLLNDGNVVEDWTSCASDDNGTVSYSGLADGLNRVEVRAVNDEGDRDGTPAFRTWRVDNTAPETEVFVGPPSDLPNQQPRFTNDDTPSYKFRATADERSQQQYVTYECRVMWGPAPGVWYPCGSPSDNDSSSWVHIVNGTPDFGFSDPLPEGDYEIQVRATDEVGNLGPAMIEVFRVDRTVPETALASGPEGLINTRDVDYVLGSSQGQSTFLCELEGQNVGIVFSMARCPGSNPDGSRPAFTGLADDIYTLTAIAVDPATNQDPTPLEIDFEVDATEPETTMDANVDYGDGPTTLRRTQSRKVDITFSGTDSRQLQGFQCRIDSTDDGDWEICSSVQRFSGLADGDHKVEIRAKDEAGNVDSTPEVLEWVVDRDPPVTSFTVQPDPVTNDGDPTFEFETDEAISGSVCSLDGAAPVSCSSPLTLGDLGATLPLADGVHHLSVRSTDIAGNVEQTVATVSWKQDTVDPVVSFTSKPAAFTPIGDASFAWEVRDGDPAELAPEVDAECALDPVDPDNIDNSEWTACDRDLTIAEADNTNGPHTLAVRAIDLAGNVSALEIHQWTVLGAKPASPVIDDSSPADGSVTRVGTANFAFHHELDGTGALAGLFCRIDDGTQTRCDDLGKTGEAGSADGIGSFGAEGLSDGPHTFSVVARDIAGNISEPATVSWEVQRGAPVTSIDFGPSGIRKQATATFQFSSDKPATFECKVDGGNWAVCESPLELTELAEGSHSFSVRSVSTVAPVGVKDPTPPTRNWSVDTVAPDVAINSAPEGQVVSYQGEVTFSSTDAEAGFQCKVGDGLFDACTSPWQVTGLTAGEQTVTVRAIDPAGNVSAEPATATWTVLDPVCDPDFDGTPPNCVPKAPVEGPAITAESTGGSLALPSLDPVELPENQIKLVGKRGSDGRWFVPKEDVTFAPVEQVLEDVLGPGTSVTVTISITATGNGWGVLTNGGGAARIKLPVRADVDAKLGAIALFPPGSCSLSPVTFNLVGTWDANANTAHVEQNDVAFPKLTGCGTFKETIDGLLELPRNDISIAIDLKLTQDPAECETPLVGTYPDCGPAPKITITRPVVKGPKKIKFGKKATYRVRVTNNGNTDAKGVKLCLNVPKKFFKGKARRCATVNVPAGKSRAKAFGLNRKPVKLMKNRKVLIKATATYKDGGGVSRTKRGNASVQLLKHPAKGKRGAGK